MTSKPQPHPRRRSSCHRHPTATPFTGVCASCLSERLTGIQSQSPTITASTANAELKRSKSVSGGHNPPSSSASEPRRKSCDVRDHNTHRDIDRQIEDPNLNRNPNVVEIGDFRDLEEDGEMKPMKELIDLECSSKKSSRKSIWKSASDFSKKLGKWKPKQEQEKKKKKENDVSSSNQPQISTSLREIKPEVNDYRLGRRSCDNEQRLPIEFGRFSVDDSRFCLEPPRASWDGYLFGNENLKPPLRDVMPSVVEEETREKIPGGSAQTRDYYADTASSHRRRRSFDRAGSNRKIGIGETAGLKSPLSKSPEAAGLFHGAKLLVTEKELRDSNWYSRKQSVEFVDSGVSDTKKFPKWRNLLNIRSLLQRRKETDLGENAMETVIGHRHSSVEGNWREEKLIETLRRVSNAEEYRAETLAESLQKLRRVSNADEDRIKEGDALSFVKGAVNGSVVGEKLLRSYNVGCRDEKRRESVAGQRDCGVGYSRKEIDDGLLRFYLTPLRSYGRSEAGKSRIKSVESAGVNVL